jgi:hypothetical protein
MRSTSTKWTRVFVAVLALVLVGPSVVPAAPPAPPVRDPRLSDPQEPGSFIVFPKFIKGTVAVDGVPTPQSVFEISVVCPAGAVCTQGQAVRLHVEWVCPANSKSICKEIDFFLTTTVNGTIVFDPSKSGIVAPCANGYAAAWVVNIAGAPIKFDGLIGDAVLRNSGSSAGAYNGIPIQADPLLANGAPILDVATGLHFDGLPGHYQAVTGTILSGVRFDKLTAPKVETFLTLLTLDVISNRVNTTTFVDFLFWNAAEVPTSTSTDFICFTEQQLSVDIDSNLTFESQGTAKGSFVGVASDQNFVPRSLLAIVETIEHNAGGAIDREYSYSVFNDSVVVPTTFRP